MVLLNSTPSHPAINRWHVSSGRSRDRSWATPAHSYSGAITDDVALTGIRAFIGLLAAAVVVALVTRRIRVPYTVGLVLLGLGVGIVRPRAGLAITPALVLAVLLPGLNFEAAFRIDIAALRPSLIGVLFLAVPGVLVVAVILHGATGLALSSAFLMGAMVAATDPAAVIATFKLSGRPSGWQLRSRPKAC